MTARGWVDLHCHWIAGIDDGARSVDAGLAMLRGLAALGFTDVVATPHMRPGMFDNDAAALRDAYARTAAALPQDDPTLPRVALASEHYFDDVVFQRLRAGEGLAYPGGGAVLIELAPEAFPAFLQHRFFDLRRQGITPVLAHPERYAPVWKDRDVLEPLLDAGAHLLLDVCALVGKYGRAPEKAAVALLEEDAYEAACSDAHRPEDVDTVAHAVERLRELVGDDEAERLLGTGPRALLERKRG